jgi:hypothetical protein
MSVTVASTLSIGAVFLLGALVGWLLRGRECASFTTVHMRTALRDPQLAGNRLAPLVASKGW